MIDELNIASFSTDFSFPYPAEKLSLHDIVAPPHVAFQPASKAPAPPSKATAENTDYAEKGAASDHYAFLHFLSERATAYRDIAVAAHEPIHHPSADTINGLGIGNTALKSALLCAANLRMLAQTYPYPIFSNDATTLAEEKTLSGMFCVGLARFLNRVGRFTVLHQMNVVQYDRPCPVEAVIILNEDQDCVLPSGAPAAAELKIVEWKDTHLCQMLTYAHGLLLRPAGSCPQAMLFIFSNTKEIRIYGFCRVRRLEEGKAKIRHCLLAQYRWTDDLRAHAAALMAFANTLQLLQDCRMHASLPPCALPLRELANDPTQLTRLGPKVIHDGRAGCNRVYKIYNHDPSASIDTGDQPVFTRNRRPNADLFGQIHRDIGVQIVATPPDAGVQILSYNYIDGEHTPSSVLQFASLCEILHVIHVDHQFVHGDVRQANMVFGPDAGDGAEPAVHLIDFDYARILRENPHYPRHYNGYLNPSNTNSNIRVYERHEDAIEAHPMLPMHDRVALWHVFALFVEWKVGVDVSREKFENDDLLELAAFIRTEAAHHRMELKKKGWRKIVSVMARRW